MVSLRAYHRGMSVVKACIAVLAVFALCWAGISVAQTVHTISNASGQHLEKCHDHSAGQQEKNTKTQCCKYDCCIAKVIPMASPKHSPYAYVYSYAIDAKPPQMVGNYERLDKPPKAG